MPSVACSTSLGCSLVRRNAVGLRHSALNVDIWPHDSSAGTLGRARTAGRPPAARQRRRRRRRRLDPVEPDSAEPGRTSWPDGPIQFRDVLDASDPPDDHGRAGGKVSGGSKSRSVQRTKVASSGSSLVCDAALGAGVPGAPDQHVGVDAMGRLPPPDVLADPQRCFTRGSWMCARGT